jgi:Flp pilus assembly protein TadD
MTMVVEQSAGSEATAQPQFQSVNSYIATTYFKQATSLLHRGLFAESEHYFREALRLWPDHADALNNLGTAVWNQGRLDEAERLYRQAYQLKPHDYAVLNNLGIAVWGQGRLDESAAFYRRAVELNPDSAQSQLNLGVALCDQGRYDEAIARFEESLRLRPDWPEALSNLGMTLARNGQWDEALVYYERALAIRPDFPEAHRNRAYYWLSRGDYERGWPEHEWRLKCGNHRGYLVSRPQWAGQAFAGQSVCLHAEQGMGDSLQFIRFAPLVKRRGGQVVVLCPSTLTRLLARCPGVDVARDASSPLPDVQFQASLLSLPAIFGTTLATVPAEVPYLSADAATIEHWRGVLARALEQGGHDDSESPSFSPGANSIFKVGIAWQGNPFNRMDCWRSFRLEQFAPLASLPCVRLISLQKGDGTDQLRTLAGRFRVAELGSVGPDDQRDFLDTAAVISQLDLVITPDTAIAHLAGGLGVRVWVAVSSLWDWRWLADREDTPWYPTMRLFRQSSPGDWEGVFGRMTEALRHHRVAGS